MTLFRFFSMSRLATATVLAATLALAGCLEPAPPADPPTPTTASRFLHQATFGPNQADIDRLVAIGWEAWMDEQFAQAPLDSYLDYANRGGKPGCDTCDALGLDAVNSAFWYQAIEGKDQLRQRVAFALSELFVISAASNTTLKDQELSLAAFHSMLADNAFGNFRVIIEKVALHPAMGVFLSHRQNDKEDPVSGRLPDENFAREVMQLFTIGKWQLNVDGTREKDANGNDIPAYTQSDIMGMAKVFTGWSWGGTDTSENRWLGMPVGNEDPRQWDVQMQAYPQHHSTSEKRIVNGVVIPAGASAQESLKKALDTLFLHKNAGPFVATHLIKRLVTSNPSPEYVARVAEVFNSNKEGTRGNMRSVVRAVLFDTEAYDANKLSDPQWGKLREPVVRIANYLRAFNARSGWGTYKLRELQYQQYDVGQSPWMAPSVFNFFLPDFQPPGEIATAGLTAPEFQIFDESTSAGYLNYMEQGVSAGFGYESNPINANLQAEMALANDPVALTTRLALLLNGGNLSSATRQAIENAIASVPASGTGWQLRRVKIGITLLMGSPDYLIQK